MCMCLTWDLWLAAVIVVVAGGRLLLEGRWVHIIIRLVVCWADERRDAERSCVRRQQRRSDRRHSTRNYVASRLFSAHDVTVETGCRLNPSSSFFAVTRGRNCRRVVMSLTVRLQRSDCILSENKRDDGCYSVGLKTEVTWLITSRVERRFAVAIQKASTWLQRREAAAAATAAAAEAAATFVRARRITTNPCWRIIERRPNPVRPTRWAAPAIRPRPLGHRFIAPPRFCGSARSI